MKLKNKVAIVTGASRGIGRDIALVFAREGAKVVAAARTDEDNPRIPGTIHVTVAKIEEMGGEGLAVKTDVTSEESVENLVRTTLDRYGRVDILVNNAAILVPGEIKDMLVRHWDLIWRVNMRGPFLCIQAVLPHMIEQGWGHILNISSRGAIGPGPGPYSSPARGGTAYGATKAALERFTQGLAQEVFQYNIAANALSPMRGIATEGNRYFGGGNRDYTGWRTDGEIMGDAATIICSKEPQEFTGHILYDDEVLHDAGITDLSRYTLL